MFTLRIRIGLKGRLSGVLLSGVLLSGVLLSSALFSGELGAQSATSLSTTSMPAASVTSASLPTTPGDERRGSLTDAGIVARSEPKFPSPALLPSREQPQAEGAPTSRPAPPPLGCAVTYRPRAAFSVRASTPSGAYAVFVLAALVALTRRQWRRR